MKGCKNETTSVKMLMENRNTTFMYRKKTNKQTNKHQQTLASFTNMLVVSGLKRLANYKMAGLSHIK